MEILYLIGSGMEFVKIGIANDVRSRMASLQTGNPNPLKLMACYVFQNAGYIEKALHQKFDPQRVRGEWFTLTAAQVDEFKTICISLGGVEVEIDVALGSNEIEEAEEAQEIFLDDPDYRVEPRYDNGEIRGFAIRERNADRKVIRYIGKQNPYFEDVCRLFDKSKKF